MASLKKKEPVYMARKIIFSLVSAILFLYLSIYTMDELGILELNTVNNKWYLDKISIIFSGDIYFSRIFTVMSLSSFSIFLGFSLMYSILSSTGVWNILKNSASSFGVCFFLFLSMIVSGGVWRKLFNEINISIIFSFSTSFLLFCFAIIYVLRRKKRESSCVSE